MTKQHRPLKSLIASAVGIAATSLSFGAHASLVDGIVESWTVGVNSVFSNVCDANGDCTIPNAISGYTIGSQSLRWGTGGEGPSGLDIGNSGNTTVVTNGGAVPNVTITHLNHPVTGTTLRSLDIVSTLSLTPLLPPLPGLPPVQQVFGVKFLETTNNLLPTCPNGIANYTGVNVNGCGDIFVTDAQALNFAFQYDLDGAGAVYNPVTYFISFYEATSGLNPLPDAACASVGAANGCRGFMTAESRDTTVQFASVITTAPIGIPEPGTLALLGLGLLGAGVARRRRS